jgi:hypothetical protein
LTAGTFRGFDSRRLHLPREVSLCFAEHDNFATWLCGKRLRPAPAEVASHNLTPMKFVWLRDVINIAALDHYHH